MTTSTRSSVLFRRLLRQARPVWPHLGLLLVLHLLTPSLRLLSPLPLTFAVDCVLGNRPPPTALADLGSPALLTLAAASLVALALAGQVISLGAALLSAYLGEKLVRGFRAVLFRHAQRLSLTYHDSEGTSDSAYRIQYDAPAVQWVVVDGSIPLVTSALTLCIMIGVIAGIDWQLAVVALVVAPVLFGLTHFCGRRLKKQSKELKTVESRTLGVVQEVLSALRVVKAFGQEDREQDRFVRHSGRGLRAKLRETLIVSSFGLLVGLTTAIGSALVLYLGVLHVQSGTITLGELLLVTAYLTQLYGPMETISRKVADLQGSLVSAERAFHLLDQVPDVADRPDARTLSKARGTVEFRHVEFAYPGHPPVLRDVCFRVPAGARVGIEGRTGAGKTTLVSLLTRFYDPTSGQILIDGVDLRDYRLADVRNQFAIVLQEPVLFSTSIAENIAYARPEATRDEIEAAARAASVHEFIAALPEGYDTPVGERGARLSGGERQRISLARAFLKDAPLLILDEPTSSVDVQTEALIVRAMDDLMQGRTTFIIAHRLSTLDGCDVRIRVSTLR